MSYTIHLRINQTTTDWFGIVEKTVNLGTWTEVNGEHILNLVNSGVSGTLRFESVSSDYVLVALGIHNYKRWCDIVTDLKSTDTALAIHPQYYLDASAPGSRSDMLWKQLPSIEKTDSKGRKFAVNYFEDEGAKLWVTVTIS